MAVMAREAWTDERLDDLKEHMDEGFREIKGEIRGVNAELKSTRSELKEEIGSVRTELKGEIRELSRRFDRLNFTLIASLIGLVLTRYLG